MKYGLLYTLLAAAAGVLAAGEPAPEQPAAMTWERYRVIMSRNIFAKDRQNLNPDGSAIPAVPKNAPKAPPKPESITVLAGVVERDGKLTAVLENRATGKSQVLRSGDAVAGGKVGAMTLDSIEYFNADGSVSVVVIGKTLDGGAPPTVADAAGAQETPGASGVSNDILERMRKKRQEELSK